MKKNLVICLTALNYVYAKSTGELGSHDVICANDEVMEAVLFLDDQSLCNVWVYDLMSLISFKRAAITSYKKILPNQNVNYEKVFLSFCSGWHFAFIYAALNLDFKNLFLLDDGIGNITETTTKNHFVKNILGLIFFGRKNIFSSKRNFGHEKIQLIATIYCDLLPEDLVDRIYIKDIREELRKYIGCLASDFPICALPQYGVYVQSDHGAYGGDIKILLNYLDQNITELQDKTGFQWIVKSKKTDPLISRYEDLGLTVAASTLNLELLYTSKIQAVCTRSDTFALNSMIFGLDLERFIRYDPAKLNTEGKNDLVASYAKNNGFHLQKLERRL